jgi:arylformamidase
MEGTASVSEVIDISLPLSADLPVWPGSQRFKLEPVHRQDNGDHCNESAYAANIHTGTHIDAPWHFLNDGKLVNELDLTTMIGPALVAHLPGVTEISEEDLTSISLPRETRRLLLRTDNSELWARGIREFQKDFVALTVDAAEWLASSGISLVGIDYLSIQLFAGSDRTHKVLLNSGIVILEGLNLAGVEPGFHELICLPLSISGAEGAPARAILRTHPRRTESS